MAAISCFCFQWKPDSSARLNEKATEPQTESEYRQDRDRVWLHMIEHLFAHSIAIVNVGIELGHSLEICRLFVRIE